MMNLLELIRKSDYYQGTQFGDIQTYTQILGRAFTVRQSYATMLAYIAHPKTTKYDIEKLIEEIETSSDIIENLHDIIQAIRILHDRSSQEKYAQELYNIIINLSRSCPMNINNLIFQEIVSYKRDSKLGQNLREKFRI